VRRRFAPTPRTNRLSSDAPCGSLPAGPHERCRRSTNQSAFHRRELPRKPAPSSPFRARPLPRRLSPESSFLARARSPVSPRPRPQRTERTRHRSSTSATNVKVEHTRERPVTPPADVLASTAAIEGSGRQSTGYPAGSRAPALPVAFTRPSFGTRPRGLLGWKAGTLVGLQDGRKPGEAPTCPAPRGSPPTCRANGEVVERTRVPSRRSEPRLFIAALRRLQRSRTKASIFHACDGMP